MQKLIIVTIIWAFSFSLIGEFLSGKVDSYFAAFVRILLAFLVLLPFLKKTSPKLAFQISLIGAFQIGFMYMFYYNSFAYLKVSEVAIFTIFTPFYVTLFYDIMDKKFRPLYIISASLAILGAYVIKIGEISNEFIIGFLLIQGANICFSLGQSGYKIIIKHNPQISQFNHFGYFFLGALIVSFLAFVFFGNFDKISPDPTQIFILLWLGIIASGIGYYLWNKGASEVDSGVLAIMNNAVIPLAIVINFLFWDKNIEIVKFLAGSILMIFALILHKFFIKHYEKTDEAKI